MVTLGGFCSPSSLGLGFGFPAVVAGFVAGVVDVFWVDVGAAFLGPSFGGFLLGSDMAVAGDENGG